MKPAIPFAIGLLLCGSAPAAGQGKPTPLEPAPPAFRLCSKEKAFLPYTAPDGSGRLQQRVQLAARLEGIKLEHVALPWIRCLRALEAGDVDGVIAMYSPERRAYAAFPWRADGAGTPDASRAVGVMRFGIVQRRDGAVSWDGRRLQLAPGETVGVSHGFSRNFADALVRSEVRIDSSALSTRQLIAKLEHGRHAAVVVPWESAAGLAPESTLPSTLKLLARPYAEFDAHLMVAKPFQRRHPRLVEGLWNRLRTDSATSTQRTPAVQRAPGEIVRGTHG
jgi:polar amino acid transport system substrate-binding protein